MQFVQKLFVLAAVAFASVVPGRVLAGGSYPQVGGGPGHLGVASGGGPADLSSPRFAAGPDLWWVNQSGVVVADGKVIGLTEYDDAGDTYMGVVAVNEQNGQIVWTGTAPDLVWESWSSPAIDMDNGIVLVASADRVVGLDLADGHEVWHLLAKSGKGFVNASPTVEQGVAYIAEFGNGSTLYAVHTATGQVKWQAPAGYISGANTAALTSTRVLIVTSDGRFRTFDKQTGAADVNVSISGYGFFGGVAADDAAAYAVTYAFGPRNGATTKVYKIDAASGAVIWSAKAPRTDTIPVVAGDLVLVSGGDGYQRMNDGTDQPQVWAFDKASGAFCWSTALAGGWTCQPVYADGVVYVPRLAGLQSPPMSGVLYAFDVTRTPQDAGFVVGTTDKIACGAAVANGNVYGTGLHGMFGFGPALTILGDINGDGHVDTADLLVLAAAWGSHVGDPNYRLACDLNGDGSVDVVDLLILADSWGRS